MKRLRRERGLNQSQMAGELGISAFLSEPPRAQSAAGHRGILLRLGRNLRCRCEGFASEGGTAAGPTQLAEIYSDPMLADLGVARYELVELADNAPAVAEGIARLYTALRECSAGRKAKTAR